MSLISEEEDHHGTPRSFQLPKPRVDSTLKLVKLVNGTTKPHRGKKLESPYESLSGVT